MRARFVLHDVDEEDECKVANLRVLVGSWDSSSASASELGRSESEP
jgi:hypothetical protein